MSSCNICGTYFSGLICKKCLLKLSVRKGYFCSVCGASVKKKNNVCKSCKEYFVDKKKNKYTPYIYSLWHYTSELKSILFLYKKQGLHIFGQYFAKQISPLFYKITKTFDTHTHVYIVSVPPHPKNKKKVGFDCIALMASYLALYTKSKYLKHTFIRKKSLVQKELNVVERKTNMQNALKINRGIKKYLQTMEGLKSKNDKKVIILLDDVVTTGATMQACYEKIKTICPNIPLYGISVCRVD